MKYSKAKCAIEMERQTEEGKIHDTGSTPVSLKSYLWLYMCLSKNALAKVFLKDSYERLMSRMVSENRNLGLKTIRKSVF